MNLLKTPKPDPAEELVDAVRMKKLDVELTVALQKVEGWTRLDDDSFVSANNGEFTVVGNSGGWRLVRLGPEDQLVSEPYPSAQEALAAAGVSPR